MSSDGRTSSASSIDSTGSFENLNDPREMELHQLRTEVSLLKKEFLDKRSEAQKLKESTLKSQISGEWKIVASRNVEEYLEKTEGSEVDDIVFQLADIHFQFDDFQKVTVFHKIGEKRYDEKELRLDGPKWSDGTCSTTYFTEKSMKTVEEGLAEQEICVEDGSLKIVEKRGGVTCERTYEPKKMGVSDLDVKLRNWELVKQVEKLTEDNEALQNAVEKLKDCLKLNSQQSEEPEEPENILKSIIGFWIPKISSHKSVIFQMDGEGNLMQKWNDDKVYTIFTLGEKNSSSGWTLSVDEQRNRLLGKGTTPEGEIFQVTEWFMKDGELILEVDGRRRAFRKDGESQ